MRERHQEQTMRYTTFDTHKYIKELEASGFKEEQAEVIVKSLLASRDFDLATLATREQFNTLQGDISLIRNNISAVKNDILALEKKMDEKIDALGENIDLKINAKISEVNANIALLKVDMTRWVIAIFAGMIIGFVSILVKIW